MVVFSSSFSTTRESQECQQLSINFQPGITGQRAGARKIQPTHRPTEVVINAAHTSTSHAVHAKTLLAFVIAVKPVTRHTGPETNLGRWQTPPKKTPPSIFYKGQSDFLFQCAL